MKKSYISPEVELIWLEVCDLLTASTDDPYPNETDDGFTKRY